MLSSPISCLTLQGAPNARAKLTTRPRARPRPFNIRSKMYGRGRARGWARFLRLARIVSASGMVYGPEVRVLSRGPDEGNPSPIGKGARARAQCGVGNRGSIGSRRCATVSSESKVP